MPLPPFDWDDPLGRIPGRASGRVESRRANAALRDYYNMGPGRSLRKLLERYRHQAADEPDTVPATCRWTTLAGWSARFLWQDRVGRQTEIDDDADKALWDERRREVRRADWSQSAALRELGDRILAEAPEYVRERTLKSGVVVRSLDGRLMIQAIKTASELARLAAGMESQRALLEHSGRVDVVDGIDIKQLLSDLGDDEIALLAEIAGRIGGDPAGERTPEPG